MNGLSLNLKLVLGGQAFLATRGSGPVAGERPHVQLLNPAGSGKRGVLTKIHLSSDVAEPISLRRYNTALTGAGTPINKNGLAGTGALQLRDQTNPILLGSFIFNIRTQALVQQPLTFGEWPLILPPGVGLVIGIDTVNTNLVAGFEWIEIDG